MSKNHITLASLLALSLAAAPALAAPEVKTKGGFEIKDGDFSFKIGANVQFDFVEPGVDVTPMGSNLFLRRMELELSGAVAAGWNYKIEYDFAENVTTMKETYVSYTGYEGSEILLGQFKQPFGLEEVNSSKGIGFLERSLMNSAWGTSYRTGIGYRKFGDNYTAQLSVYGKEAGQANGGTGASANQDEPISIGARFVWAPIKSDDSLLHLGLAYAQEELELVTGGGLRLRARPEARPSNGSIRLVDTGTIADATGMTKTGLEAVWMKGGLSFTGEYQIVQVDSVVEGDPQFSGYYLEARWFPGGEVRPYKMSTGAFSNIKPLSIEGAWEFRARLSNIDLEDACVAAVVALPCVGANAEAGTEDNITVGVTYYPNANVRYMVEYVQADVSSLLPAQEESPTFLQGRVQITF